MIVEWIASYANTEQDEPDTRIFTDHYADIPVNGQTQRVYSIPASTYSNPARYFRNIEEEGKTFQRLRPDSFRDTHKNWIFESKNLVSIIQPLIEAQITIAGIVIIPDDRDASNIGSLHEASIPQGRQPSYKA